MNQILDYNPIRNGDGDNYGSNNNKNDKVVKVFAMILIIFAFCLAGIGAFNMIKNNAELEKMEQSNTKAKIQTVQDGNKLKITVEHDKKILKLVYNWNTSAEKTLAVDTGNTFETTIDIPAGENTLNIQVIDIDNNETFDTKTIVSEDGIDIINPVIKFEITEEKKIKITATDETALDFITYRWNNEDEVAVEADEDEPEKIEVEIPIKEGENNLTITAVDKSNNTDSVQQGFEGLKQPTIEVVLTEDKSKLQITCEHESGIAKIEYTLNDRPYAATLEEGPTTVTFEQALDEGNNVIILNVTSVEGTISNFGGQCTYEPDTRDIVVE